MRLIITGGAGFIGSNFVHYMLENHPEYFPDDGVHPNSEGATVIANIVYAAIINFREAL